MQRRSRANGRFLGGSQHCLVEIFREFAQFPVARLKTIANNMIDSSHKIAMGIAKSRHAMAAIGSLKANLGASNHPPAECHAQPIDSWQLSKTNRGPDQTSYALPKPHNECSHCYPHFARMIELAVSTSRLRRPSL